MISAKIVEDSLALGGTRLTTLELCYPRFIHSEFMTHRVFSRNAMSSRAIPVAKMIDQVRKSPAMPVHWGANQPGMQAQSELREDLMVRAKAEWLRAAESAAEHAQTLTDIGLHKQIANRVLEPFQWMRTIVSATEWRNFFDLRCHPDAQPEFQVLALAIREALTKSTPVGRRDGYSTDQACWHLPYVTALERKNLRIETLPKISAARCARVSYLTHDNQTPTLDADLNLFERLVGGVPLHASPIEHQAYAEDKEVISRNFRGWRQFREVFEKTGASNA